MKRILLFVVWLTIAHFSFSQFKSEANKPNLTIDNCKNWKVAVNGKVSNDGNYILYSIINDPGPGMVRNFVKSTKKEWEKEIFNAIKIDFSDDGKQLIWKTSRDSIIIWRIDKNETEIIPDVLEYQLRLIDAKECIMYRSKDRKDELVIRELFSKRQKYFNNVLSFQFSNDNRQLLIELAKNDSISSFKLMNNLTGNAVDIFEGKRAVATNFTFSNNGDKLAFFVEGEQSQKYLLYYYADNIPYAKLLLSDKDLLLENNKIDNSRIEFTLKDDALIINLKPTSLPPQNSDGVAVDVWSYLDTELQSVQFDKLKYPVVFAAAVRIVDGSIVRLERDNEKIVGLLRDHALVQHGYGNEGVFEANWNSAARYSFSLVSLYDGSRILIKDGIINPQNVVGISPNGNWLIYYDESAGNYFCYEYFTGIKRNITEEINTNWKIKDDDHPEKGVAWKTSIPSWLMNDDCVLIYDSYDIWLVDPKKIRKPENITRNLGSKMGIRFSLADIKNDLGKASLKRGASILLRAVDTKSKDRGFYRVKLGSSDKPEKLTMGPYIFGEWAVFSSYNEYVEPILRARDCNTYLLRRMSATSMLNYEITKDFVQYKKVTDLQPQLKFNWLTTELIRYKLPSGRLNEGILYKPENFDSSKKYPVIFDYYEIRSDELNLYIPPHASDARINIPLFVSNGYLVFVPDIHYVVGNPGESAYESLVSAAKYLSGKHFVDTKKLGLQGHSWGGYQTNYIISRTDLFSAACSAAGYSNLISWYGSAARGSYPQYSLEREQGRMGGTPWEIPANYIANSPIFNADKISTPLLMMNNKNDRVVYFSQGLELFTALRRLGKKVWMLQYDEGGHSLMPDKNGEDFHKRMMQFFDHYLKDKPMPEWMKKGIPAKLKGRTDGMKMDSE
ncbi:MAG: prolyl oligopeptidase family serine peptidase [Candidatus Pseudobacter hemicellulosilyticus]|uniref:Prolyl oligopeptidase family serine peptidase n=1 Tax=Candidatus Pseudobacter hemicellulosilyticus TaxID=3121375 RepID=A0AAJ6BJG2_9BACT|nr:MAG: prolyl oligopeptidase family serine peptidase [Pseudobacter sp.]